MGKGVTFDSGGYNLKAGPGSMIEMMKVDRHDLTRLGFRVIRRHWGLGFRVMRRH